MGFLRRALVSIIRKKPQSLILLLVVFILGNIMISTLLIVQSVRGTKETILKELPPAVSLEINYEKMDEFYTDPHSITEFKEIPWLTFDDLDRIEAACGAYIKSYDYSSSYGFETKSLQRYRMEGDDFVILPRAAKEVAALPVTDYFTLQGVSIPNFILLEIGDAIIIEGRTFTEDEIKNGSPVLIMSKEMAELNNFRAGDLVEIECLFTDYTDQGEQVVYGTLLLEMELVGILEYKEPLRTGNNEDYNYEDYMLVEKKNNLITSNRFVADFMEKDMDIRIPYLREKYGENIEPWIDTNPLAGGMPITYILKSSEDVESFVTTAAATLNNEFYKFVTQEDNFKRVAEPLESMKHTLTFAFFITVGSAIVVLALILFGFMWARQKEIGIYLALGERKLKITGQMVVESAAIGLIGAALALVSGMFVASYISDLLIAAPSPDELGMIISPITNNYLSNIDYESVINSYQVGLSATAVAMFFVAILATIIVSQLIASLYILRLDPKKILM